MIKFSDLPKQYLDLKSEVDSALNEIINDTLKVKEVMDIALKKWGSGSYVIQRNNKNLHEANLLMLDINKSITKLGWKPSLNSSKAIDLTINWYKQVFKDHEDPYSVSLNQMLDYFNN